MMRSPVQERIRYRLIRFGKKNIFCKALAMPALFFVMFFSRIIRFLGDHAKKILMLTLVSFFVVVFSSLSLWGQVTGYADSNIFGDLDENVSLAVETGDEETTQALLSDARKTAGHAGDDPISEDSGMITPVVSYSADQLLEEMTRNRLEQEEVVQESPQKDKEKAGDSGGECRFDPEDWRLILVNKQNSIPEGYEFPLGTITAGFKCDARILEDLQAMLEAASADGIVLAIRSPYRPSWQQVMNFQEHIDRFMATGMSYMEAYKISSIAVTIPGSSEHEIGLALDITSDHWWALTEEFGQTEAGKWLYEHCDEYGFILRYPDGKEYITSIEFEPWHFRYVGKEAAKYIMDRGITLEEFWEEVF